MNITFGPATAQPKKVVIGLAGQTGSGKTMSALELGTGLVHSPQHELFVIDTEYGRASHYADAYAFQSGELSAPFTPVRYQNAIEASIAYGSQCTIVDSMSHMWEGQEGLLDWHAEIALKMAGGNESRTDSYNFPAWREPKQALQAFVLYLQRCPIHLILCFRAKAKSKMVKAVGSDGRSRTEIVDAGLQPIIDTATPYEATFLAMLSQEEPGVPHWTHKALASYLKPIFDGGPKRLSREHGKRLAQWCGSAGLAVADAPRNIATKSAEPSEAAPERITKKRAEQIMAALRDAPTLAALDDLWSRLVREIITASVEGQQAIKRVYEESRTALEAIDDSMRKHAASSKKSSEEPSFHDVIDELEPEDWKNENGRVEDDRQPELPT